MIDKLLRTGVLQLKAASLTELPYALADREAYVSNKKIFASIGVVLNIPLKVEQSWLIRLTLLLAASEETMDCALQRRGERWILWQSYSEKQDEETLNRNMLLQLALAQYIESQHPSNK